MNKTKKDENLISNGNGKSAEKGVKEFDFGDSKTAKSLIKAVTLTRQRLYPERYDSKGRLKKNGQNNL